MRVKALESRLNRRLEQIHKGYAVKNLRRLTSGEYWFDLAMGFNERDMAKVNRVFAELLRQHRVRAVTRRRRSLTCRQRRTSACGGKPRNAASSSLRLSRRSSRARSPDASPDWFRTLACLVGFRGSHHHQ